MISTASYEPIENTLHSKLIIYPDGAQRLLTMYSFEWERVAEAERAGYFFNDILWAAQVMAKEHPSGKGYGADVLYRTKYMLMVIAGAIYEEKMDVLNSAF